MLFGTKQKLKNVQNFNLFMGGELLERVECFKYLGVKLDQHLNFEEHINWVYKKSSMKLGAIRKIRTNLPQSVALSLYKSLVLPHLDYCDIVYSCTSEANLQKLQKVQNSACRTLLRADRRAHIQDMHKELKLLPLAKRREYHMATECYRQVTNPNSSLHNLFQINHGRRTRTGNKKVKVPDIRTATGRKSFSFRGPECWNGVDEDLKSSENLDAFKRAYLNKVLRDVNHPE